MEVVTKLRKMGVNFCQFSEFLDTVFQSNQLYLLIPVI